MTEEISAHARRFVQAPHPALPAFYEDERERPRLVRSLFDETAADYDRINRWFSLGSGSRFRRESLARAGLRPGMRMLDVAVGTGLVAEAAITLGLGREAVVGVDVSAEMLAEAKRKLGIGLLQASAEGLPFADASFDFLSMGYALRHVADLGAAFREYARVLRPGGRLLLLEIAKPEKPLTRALAHFYIAFLMPLVCRVALGSDRAGALMRYYWTTIEHCVAPSVILSVLGDAGFDDARSNTLFDAFRNYTARKPATQRLAERYEVERETS